MENFNIPSSFPAPGTPLPVPPIAFVEAQIINEAPAALPLSPVSKPTVGKYLLFRSGSSGDKVFLLRKGKKHWVTSPEKLAELEYTFADVTKVPDEELDFYPEGESL